MVADLASVAPLIWMRVDRSRTVGVSRGSQFAPPARCVLLVVGRWWRSLASGSCHRLCQRSPRQPPVGLWGAVEHVIEELVRTRAMDGPGKGSRFCRQKPFPSGYRVAV